MVKYVVITKVPKPDGSEEGAGNLADAPMASFGSRLYVNVEFAEGVKPQPMGTVKYPVFTQGEIIVADDDGRVEICGSMRKPHKWFVEYEVFDDVNQAIEKAKEVWEV